MAKPPGARGRPPDPFHLPRLVVKACRSISPTRKAVWIEVSHFPRGCYLTSRTLAGRLGLTYEGVRSAVRWLRVHDLLEITVRGPDRPPARVAYLPPACHPESSGPRDVARAAAILGGWCGHTRGVVWLHPGGGVATPPIRERVRRDGEDPKIFSIRRSQSDTEQADSPEGERLAPDLVALKERLRREAGLPAVQAGATAEQTKQMFRRAAARAREARLS